MRKSKIPTAPPGQRNRDSSKGRSETPNLSLMDPSAFMEGLQSSHGKALHSTALEEDLETEEAQPMNKGKAMGKEDPRKRKVTSKQHGAPVKKKKMTETGGEKKKKRVRSEEGGTAKRKKSRDVSPETDQSDVSHQPAPKPPRPTAAPGRGRGRGRGRASGRTSPVRPRKEQQTISKKTSESDGDTSDMESLMMNSQTMSECPSPAEEAEGSHTREERSKRVGRQATATSDVVLDAFRDFCDQYKRNVQSQVVRVAIDDFYTHVEDQILEKMSTDKELKVLKRANAKVASALRTKTQRLLGAKYELRRAERKVSLLQKEETEMKQRLDDLRRGVAFLQDLRGLNQQYLLHRRKHPKEKETYGASSLPALQLEVEQPEPRLKWMNKNMEKKLDKKRT